MFQLFKKCGFPEETQYVEWFIDVKSDTQTQNKIYRTVDVDKNRMIDVSALKLS